MREDIHNITSRLWPRFCEKLTYNLHDLGCYIHSTDGGSSRYDGGSMIEVLVVVLTLKSGMVLTMASHAPDPKTCERVKPAVEAHEMLRADAAKVQSVCLEFQG